MKLQHLADEVSRIAKTLASYSESNPLHGGSGLLSDAVLGYRFEGAMYAPEISAAEVRGIIKMRRLRDQFFDPELFADPAWDMMLDLLAARAEHSRVSVSSLCIAAAVPATTALRWIKTLTDQGIFIRVADPTDGRRVFIELSDKALTGLTKFMRELNKAGTQIV
jgi:predicted transcriptional regulator